MKINILYKLRDDPTGGGNQFLKALKKFLVKKDIYIDNADEADIILVNSHHYIDDILQAKLKNQDKLFIHRIDGPMKLYNNLNDDRDDLVFLINKYISDCTVFQSNWSEKHNYQMGLKKNKFSIIIPNAVDESIFNEKDKCSFKNDSKIKIIITSWSDNLNKGFMIYKWIDDNFDFNKYQITFVGNSPVKFKNIKYLEPLKSNELADEIKKNDIYLTASKNDPCSNSLLEALSCSLPAVVFNSGGHPEIIGKSGEVFNKKEEIEEKIIKIINNYKYYQKNIKVYKIDDIGKKYMDFFKMIYDLKINNEYIPKKISYFNILKIKKKLKLISIKSKVFNIFNKIKIN